MKKLMVLALAGLSLASCTQTEKGAGIGAASGAVIGGLATGNVRGAAVGGAIGGLAGAVIGGLATGNVRGAAVGGAIGGVAGAVIGNVSEQPGQCYYRDRYGRRYIDSCPRGGY